MNNRPFVSGASGTSLGARLRALALLFLKLGATSFGGPAASTAMMENELVRQRQWITRQQFLDIFGLTNLIPGANSAEIATYIGFTRAGWAGLAVAGISFVAPAVAITLVFAWAYVHFGTLPLAESLLGGIKPAMIAVIAISVSRLGKSATRDASLAVVGILSTAAFLAELNPLLILVAGGLIGIVLQTFRKLKAPSDVSNFTPGMTILKKSLLLSSSLPTASTALLVAAATSPLAKKVPVFRLGWFFLRVGAVLYGGGYVLFAFIEQGLVRDHHWLTQAQVLDAIAIGQLTPGPFLSTATFVGYLLGGLWGAVVSTVAICLPSFVYMAILGPILAKVRQSPWMSAFLDYVNMCAVGLMAGVTIRLAGYALNSYAMCAIALAAVAALWKWKVNPVWVVLGGGLAGMVLSAVL